MSFWIGICVIESFFFLSSFDNFILFFSQNQKLKTQDTTIYISCSLYWMNFVGYIKIVGFFFVIIMFSFFFFFFLLNKIFLHSRISSFSVYIFGRSFYSNTHSLSHVFSAFVVVIKKNKKNGQIVTKKAKIMRDIISVKS